METLLMKKWRFQPKDDKSHITIPFQIEERAQSFCLNFYFDPMEITNKEDVAQALSQGMAGADYDEEEAHAFMKEYELSLYNHLTLTLYRKGEIIGTNHRHETEQHLVFSVGSSPLGFLSLEDLQGDYELILSLQACFGEIKAQLVVEAEYD